MVRRPRAREIGLALVIVVTVLSGAAAGQDVAASRELPMMLLRVCPTLRDAQIEATKAYALGQKPYADGALDALRHPGCRIVHTRFTPRQREPSIMAYAAWWLAWDPTSSQHVGGVPVRPDKQTVMWWVGTFVTEGARHQGWAEVPERPYMVEYERAQPAAPVPPAPAPGSVQFCNGTPKQLRAAIAYWVDWAAARREVVGWFVIDPRECRTVLTTMNEHGFYAHATSYDGQWTWGADPRLDGACPIGSPGFRECHERISRTTGFGQGLCVRKDRDFRHDDATEYCKSDRPEVMACLHRFRDGTPQQRGSCLPDTASFGFVNPNDNDPSVRRLLESGGFYTRDTATGAVADYKSSASAVRFRYVFVTSNR